MITKDSFHSAIAAEFIDYILGRLKVAPEVLILLSGIWTPTRNGLDFIR
jgi:hypothetical protein